MIQTFADRETEKIFNRQFSKRWPRHLQRVALRRLQQLDAASRLDTLRIPPSNFLEALKGDRQGQYSIRINRQWRVCFIWQDGNAYSVEIVDYH